MTAEPGTGGDAALHVEDLTVSYQQKPVLWDIDLTLPRGVLGAVVGPNGAGKSTLLKTVLGIVRADAGSVRVLGHSYRAVRKRVGYVPQRSSIDWDFPTTALEVATMGLYGELGWIRRPGRQARRRALEALELVGMADYGDRPLGRLSGGQQQRVFLARALVQDADLYLLDEPLVGVDATTEAVVIDLLRGLRDRGKTVLVVHHDLESVAATFDWVAVLNVRLVAAGPVAEVFRTERLQEAYGGSVALLGLGVAPPDRSS